MTNYQAEIVANVDARGYRVKRDGIRWTDEQYAARQVCKLGEELGELVTHVRILAGVRTYSPAWVYELGAGRSECKDAFDNEQQWKRNFLLAYPDAAASEAADMLVVLYNLADALGVDLNALALEKSKSDVERGVR